MKQVLSCIAAFGVAIYGGAAGAATITFFAEDLSANEAQLGSTPNSDAKETEFLNNLTDEGTEDFEGFSDGDTEPLNLSFPGFGGGTLSATLSGGGGEIEDLDSLGNGRYPTSGNLFWEVAAGGANNFTIDFGQDISAFGFYGIDIGDFGGQLQLELGLSSGGTQIVNVPHTEGSNGSTGGSVFYFAVIQTLASEAFNSISFLTSTGNGDVFGFDDFTIAELEQVTTPEVPLPAGVWLLLTGVAGLGAVSRRKSKKS